MGDSVPYIFGMVPVLKVGHCYLLLPQFVSLIDSGFSGKVYQVLVVVFIGQLK